MEQTNDMEALKEEGQYAVIEDIQFYIRLIQRSKNRLLYAIGGYNTPLQEIRFCVDALLEDLDNTRSLLV